MLPRRTLRPTSRTATKPANSLVNPWVSRMNSSAKQTSPISPRRDVPSRVANFSLFGQALPDVLETVPDLPPPGRNMPSTAGIRQGGKLGTGAAPVPVPNPPLVEWRKPAIGGSPGALPALPAHRKGTVNGVLLQSGLFIEYYRPERIIARFRQAGI